MLRAMISGYNEGEVRALAGVLREQGKSVSVATSPAGLESVSGQLVLVPAGGLDSVSLQGLDTALGDAPAAILYFCPVRSAQDLLPLPDLVPVQPANFEDLVSLASAISPDASLLASRSELSAILESFDGLIYICGQDFRIEYLNQAFQERLGRDATGEPCYTALHNRSEICPWCVNERVFKGETVRWDVQSPRDNRWMHVVNSLIRYPDGRKAKMALIQDCTERKQAEEELRRYRDRLEQLVEERTRELSETNRRLAREIEERRLFEEKLCHQTLHDPLTGLPNRTYLFDRLERAIQLLKSAGQSFHVLFLDLDDFKAINDSLGQMKGDQLLMAAADRIRSQVRETDTVARLGGDEFIVLVEKRGGGARAAVRVAKRLRNELRRPYDLDGIQVHATASIGIALITGGYDKPEDILRDANLAMRKAKEERGDRLKTFTVGMLQGVKNRIDLEMDMRKALESDQFVLYYQPIHALDSAPGSNTLQGFEALVRWNHPEQGVMPPARFVSLAESTGLIMPLGYTLLTQACRQLSAWSREFPGQDFFVSVNLSARQFDDQSFVGEASRIISAEGVDPGRLILELTESMVMIKPELALSRLNRLRRLGLRLSVDDFGTGYSSMAYLQRFPLTSLKIDRTFTERMSQSVQGREIVRAILQLARGLGLKAIAEGVETEEQLSLLRSLGCELAQGFFFSRPMPAEQADEYLQRHLACAAGTGR